MSDLSDSVRWFESIRLEDVPAGGGKNASLGQMFGEMASEGVRVPDGFALTVRAYCGAWQELAKNRFGGGAPGIKDG